MIVPVELNNPPMERSIVPVTHPVKENAYGRESTPAPNIVLHMDE